MEGGVMETPFVVVEDLLSVFTVSVEIVVLDSWRRICVAVVTPFSACTVYILCRDDASRNARKAAFHFICVIKNLRVYEIISFVLSGLILGSRKGAASVAVYVALGLSGVPVFTQGGGPGYIFQPTFGYLLGFIAGAWLTGKLSEHMEKLSFVRILFANLAGLLVVYLFGMVYVYIINNYYLNTPIGIWPVVLYCFLLAVPGDICLCVLAAVLAKKLYRAGHAW